MSYNLITVRVAQDRFETTGVQYPKVDFRIMVDDRKTSASVQDKYQSVFCMQRKTFSGK